MVGWKFTKFLISCLKSQASFSLNFASLSVSQWNNSSVHFQLELITVQVVRLSPGHMKIGKISYVIFQATCQFSWLLFPSLFIVMKNNSSVFLLLKPCIFWTKANWKEHIKVLNFGLSISTNFYFNRLFLLKVYKVSAKNVQKNYVSWHWRIIQNLKKNLFVVSKMTKTWRILIQALKRFFDSSKNLHFDWSLPCKVYNVWPKKNYRGVLFHDTEESSKIWRKTDLRFGKREIWQIFDTALESVRIGIFIGFFFPK